MTVTQRAFQWTSEWIPTDIVSPEAERYRLYASGLGVLYEGDCLQILPLVQDESIDTIFADPPFNLARDYGANVIDELPEDKYLNWSKEWLTECTRLLKPGGSLFLYNLPKWNLVLGNYLIEKGFMFRHRIRVNIKLELGNPGRAHAICRYPRGLFYGQLGEKGVSV